ncbi:MAG: peptidoglycan DD-metalloendopeptidase family protein [Gemmataceae bacterium]|nr:peptidoglycan DD-metalloendopeptidase family protein [Gemmataceae bacterium]
MSRLFEDPHSGLLLPVPGDRPIGRPFVSQGYGPENTDPSVKKYYAKGYHPGIDIAGVPEGTPILSADTGVVRIAGVFEGKGNTVGIERDDGVLAIYGHMTRIDATLGQRVTVGDQLGGVGHTGVSEGDHLHYETRRNGTDVDPTPFLKAAGTAGGGTAPADGETAVVREELNLREGPSTLQPVLLVAQPGTVVTLGKEGWLPVLCSEQRGWMSAKYLDIPAQEGTGFGLTATVREDLNLRAGPSTEEEIVLTAPAGTAVTVGQGFWVPVTARGLAGWMSAEFLDVR